MRELFVWYSVPRERAAAARVAVEAMQRSIMTRFPGLEARLLIRDQGNLQTWMETYARGREGDTAGGGIDADLEAAIAAGARTWASLIEGERHVEAFALAHEL